MSKGSIKPLISIFLILMSCLVVLGTNAMAQFPRPSLTVEGDFLGKMKLDDPPISELRDNSSEVSVANFGISFNYPFISDQGKTMFFLEGKYRQRYLSYHRWPANISKEVNRLHEINLGLTFRQTLGESWAVTINVTPQLASNFEADELAEDDFKLQGALIFEKTFSEKWTAGLGPAYSSTFGEPIPLPLLTFRFESGGRWYASGNLPADLNIFCRMSSLFDLGLVAKADGGMYHIAEVFPTESSIEDPELQYVSVMVGPAAKIYFEGMEFSLRGGLAYQSYGMYDGTDEITDYKYDFELGPIVNAGLNISF